MIVYLVANYQSFLVWQLELKIVMFHFQENEKSRDIIIEQRFHKQIIGTKGEAIQKLREQFPSVLFTFPDIGKKSDIINLRGDKNEVDKAYKQLMAINKELVRFCVNYLLYQIFIF